MGAPSCQNPAAVRADQHTVVANQPGEQFSIIGQGQKREGQAALARARGSANEHTGFAKNQRTGVNGVPGAKLLVLGAEGGMLAHNAAGREITKRAPAPCRTISSSRSSFSSPATVPAGETPSTRAVAWRAGALIGAGRFCAQMRPPWASTICREIERPSPEFWPKPWLGRSV